MKSRLQRIITKLATPLLREWPFMLIFMLQMGLKNVLTSLLQMGYIADDNGNVIFTSVPWGWLSFWFLMAYLLAALIVVCRRRYVKFFFYAVTFVLFVVQHFLMLNFRMRIGPMCFILLAETTGVEARDFLHQYIFTPAILPVLKTPALYVLLTCLLEFSWARLRQRFTPSLRVKALLAAVTLIALTSGLYATRIFGDVGKASPDDIDHIPYPGDPFSAIFASYASLQGMEKAMAQAVQCTRQATDVTLDEAMADDSLTIVLIIGESYIKWHAQLYGYPLRTTPYMQQEQLDGRLFAFSDVLTPSNLTTEVMKNILSCNNWSEGEQWCDAPFFPALFKQAGYEVYLWDNQRDTDPVANYSFTLNSFLYNPQLCDLAYTRTNMRSFDLDGDAVQAYQDSVGSLPTPHNLVLFHLIGQHHDVNTHFPHPAFSHFTADSIPNTAPYLDLDKKQYIAAYDNATLYNDFVVHQIMEMFKEEKTFMLYLSDHGEEVYDYRDYFGRDQAPVTPEKRKYQYEIPFIIWCSEAYKEAHPEMIENIRRAQDKPFMSDLICHLLFHVGGIQTPYYKASYDLLSPHYCSPRRMLRGTKN